MKAQLLITAMATALLFSSCGKDPIKSEVVEEAIQFNGKITNQKASTGGLSTTSSWQANQAIGVTMVQLGTPVILEQANNKKYVFNGTSFLPETGQEIYYPVNMLPVDFIAYAPHKSGLNFPGPINIDVAVQSDQAAIDLLWAKSNNGGVGFLKTAGLSVPLTFDHKLSKIIIKPTASAGLSNTDPTWGTMVININGMYTKAIFDLFQGTISTPTVKQGISPKMTAAGQTYEAIVLPGNNPTAGAFSITFVINGNQYTYTSTANEDFEAGKEYTYNLAISKTGVNLGAVTVNDWVTVSRSGLAN